MVITSRRPVPKNRLTISLDHDSYTALAELAKQRERSMSWIISRALKGFLQTEKQQATKRLPDGDLGNDR
jgi:predicted transcriptional regulator